MTTDEREPMQCDRCGKPHATGCRGHRRDGNPCGNPPMANQRVCRMHGGSSPGAREKAEQRKTEQDAGRVLAKIWNPNAEPVTNAVLELQQLAGSARVALNVLGLELDGEVCESCGRGPTRDAVQLVAFQRQQRLLLQVLESMERLGISKQALEHDEFKIRLLAVAVARMLDRLEVDAERRAQEMAVLLGELRSLPAPEPTGGGEAA